MNPTENTTPAAEETKPTSILGDLNALIRDNIQGSGSKIKDIYVSVQVEKEVKRRADLLEKLVMALTKFKSELNKFKPDNVTYHGDGSVLSEGWSKPKLEEKKKAYEKFKKNEKILEDALVRNDYSKVEGSIKELSGGGNNNNNQKPESSEDSES